MLLSAAFASDRGAPSFRTGAPLPLPESAALPAESPQAGAGAQALFGPVGAIRTRFPAQPRLPRTHQPVFNEVQAIPTAGGPMPLQAIPAAGSRAGAGARPPETPLALQRHPVRNLAVRGSDPAFTLRSPGDGEVLAQVSVGLQNATWHTDNVANAERRLAVSETIMEWRPILRLDIGAPPSGSLLDSRGTEYYVEIQYAPTIHTLLRAGTSTTLHHVAGEIGRATPVLRSAVRCEYDENIFGARGDNTLEDSSTVSELSALIEYGLTAKTTLRAEGIWRRVTSGNEATDRDEYILDAGLDSATSVKTALGAGMELGHVLFDRDQLGSQDYVQGYTSMAWQATRKVRAQTRVGVELRQFEAPVPKPDRVTPVATVIVNWVPDEGTRVNVGFRIRNQPSIVIGGSTFQELRFGADARHDLPRQFYVRAEAAVIRRKYDGGARDTETFVRPAIGYRMGGNRIFDSLNLELYYHFRRTDSNVQGADIERSLFGIESTVYF
ncbi:MAG: outer membrane beta-barrel protein [Chthoniobacteraceae bacterium]